MKITTVFKETSPWKFTTRPCISQIENVVQL